VCDACLDEKVIHLHHSLENGLDAAIAAIHKNFRRLWWPVQHQVNSSQRISSGSAIECVCGSGPGACLEHAHGTAGKSCKKTGTVKNALAKPRARRSCPPSREGARGSDQACCLSQQAFSSWPRRCCSSRVSHARRRAAGTDRLSLRQIPP
jgi:hypothetical protein